MAQAVSCGCDPMAAWDYTPGELLALIDGYRQRQTERAYFGYNLAQCITAMCFAKRRPEPWEAFPGVIESRAMTDEEIWAALDAWAEGAGAACEQED